MKLNDSKTQHCPATRKNNPNNQKSRLRAAFSSRPGRFNMNDTDLDPVSEIVKLGRKYGVNPKTRPSLAIIGVPSWLQPNRGASLEKTPKQLAN